MSPLLVLVGPPGSGKTTVGRLVADKLGVEFQDTDALVEQRAGKSVPDIFIDDGEPHFRAMEKQAVAEALAGFSGVLALGGGAVLDADTRTLLQPATVIALRVALSDAVRRVGMARDRPLLLDAPRVRLAGMLRDRAPLYAEVASLTVDTSRRPPEDVVADVMEWLHDHR